MHSEDDKGFSNGEYKVEIKPRYESEEEQEFLYEYHRLYDVTMIPFENPRKRIKEEINCERVTKNGIKCLQSSKLQLKIGHECILFCQTHLIESLSNFFSLLTQHLEIKENGEFINVNIHENRILIKTKTNTSYVFIKSNVFILNGVQYFSNIIEFVEFCIYNHIFESPLQIIFYLQWNKIPKNIKDAIYLNHSTKVVANIQIMEYDETLQTSLLSVHIDVDFT